MAKKKRARKKLTRKHFFGDDGPTGKNRKVVKKPLSKSGG